MKRTAWVLFLSFVSIGAAQSDTSKSKAPLPSVLQLNAKSVLLQTYSSDEYVVDTATTALPSANPAKSPAWDTTNKSPGSSLNSTQTKPLNQNFPHEMSSQDLLKTKEIFRTLGSYHKLMGIYGTVTGALGILAGVILLDKSDDTAFAISFITLGGITIGFGLWEINIGGKLLKHAGAEK